MKDAVDRADTLSDDCDIRRLMSVYGQMATLFHAQNLPTDEQEAILQVRNCARRQKDTLTYIRSIELMVPAVTCVLWNVIIYTFVTGW